MAAWIVDPGFWSLVCGALVMDPGLWSLGCGSWIVEALDVEPWIVEPGL